MTDRLSPQREAEIGSLDLLALMPEKSAAIVSGHLAAMQSELAAVRAELEKYVGKEPTVAEEMEYLSGCLNAVRDLCDEAKRDGCLGITPEAVEQATDGQRPDNPNDRRRRIYVDGKGDGWIDVSADPETGERDVAGITNPWKICSAAEVRDDTGSLREIGRCW